jgi:signal transduction histidine kinase
MDLGELLATAIEDARLEGSPRRVTLHVEGEEAAAAFQGDPRLIHSAFENILRNAVRHSPEGGVITVSLGRPARSAARPEYVVQFQDNGPGVPEAMLDKIFGPFVRVDGAHSGGVGLGLAITRRAILAHGGSVRAESADGGGLRVIVRLPAEW